MARPMRFLVGFLMLLILLVAVVASAEAQTQRFCYEYGGVVDITWQGSITERLPDGLRRVSTVTYHIDTPEGLQFVRNWSTENAWYETADGRSMLHGLENADLSDSHYFNFVLWQSGDNVSAAQQQSLRAQMSPAEISLSDSQAFRSEYACYVKVLIDSEVPGVVYPAYWTWERMYGQHDDTDLHNHPDIGWFFGNPVDLRLMYDYARMEITSTQFFSGE